MLLPSWSFNFLWYFCWSFWSAIKSNKNLIHIIMEILLNLSYQIYIYLSLVYFLKCKNIFKISAFSSGGYWVLHFDPCSLICLWRSWIVKETEQPLQFFLSSNLKMEEKTLHKVKKYFNDFELNYISVEAWSLISFRAIEDNGDVCFATMLWKCMPV